MNEKCDIRVGWILSASQAEWRWNVRYVETRIPADVMGRTVGTMARALAGENVASEQWRAKQAFAPS